MIKTFNTQNAEKFADTVVGGIYNMTVLLTSIVE